MTHRDFGVKWTTLEDRGTECTRKEKRNEVCEGLDMLEEVNGQHFMMYSQQCYSLFANKVGLEQAGKR